MAYKALPSPEVLRQLFWYEPDTGKLFNRERGIEWFKDAHARDTWNTKFAEKEAGFQAAGRRHLKIRGDAFMSYRVAWAIFYGEDPGGILDHANGNPLDDRIENLRKCSRSENNQNRRAGGVSQYIGVSWHGRVKKWRATIKIGQVPKHLGYFKDEVAAARAYDSAAKAHHGQFARPNFP